MNKQTPQPTCEERIDEELSHELERIRVALVTDEDSEDESAFDYLEGVLEITRQSTLKVVLSTGGPADGFHLTFDGDSRLTKAEYFFQNWWDGATRVLTDNQRGIVEQMFSFLAEEVE